MTEWLTQNWDKVTTALFAFISIIFAALSWWYSKLAYQRDNAKILFKAQKMTGYHSRGFVEEKDVIRLSIVNAGRRIVCFELLLQMSFNKKNEHAIIPSTSTLFLYGTESLPKSLNEGESYSIILDYNGIKEELAEGQKIVSFTCYDTIGGAYVAKLRYKDFPEIAPKKFLDYIRRK